MKLTQLLRFLGYSLILSLPSLSYGDGTSNANANANAMMDRAVVQKAQARNKSAASDYTTVVEELYIAYFGRPADPNGMTNFANALLAANAPTGIDGMATAYNTNPVIKALIDSFSTSAESIALYGPSNANNAQNFVIAVYQNILGRPPAPEGYLFWYNAIANDTLSPSDAALSIMAGALSNTTPTGQLDTETVDNKISFAIDFTENVSASAYAGSTAAASARAMLADVSYSTNMSSYQATVDSTIAAIASAASAASTTTTTTTTSNSSNSSNGTTAGTGSGTTSSTSTGTTAASPTNGGCGVANGAAFSATPSAGLCSAGNASAIAGTGPWSWSCAGLNGGANASCSASLSASVAPINGQCGQAIVIASVSAPSTGLCLQGTPSSPQTGVDITGVFGHAGAANSNFNGQWIWSCSGQNGGTSSYCSSFQTRTGTAPTDLDGNGYIGATSYQGLPFMSAIYQNCWGCNNGLDPMQLYAFSNVNSIFNVFSPATTTQINAGTSSAQTEATSRNVVATIEAGNLIPYNGAQRWEDTWLASFPDDSGFTDMPASMASGVDSDRASLNAPNRPEFVAWRNFYSSHPQYWDTAADGGTSPPAWRSFQGQWGYINPVTPLDAVDCPPGMTSCNYGDLMAFRWSLTAAQNGGYGISLSDFTAGMMPASNSDSFNPRIVAAFAQQYGLTIPQTAVAADWIVANAFSKWSDFLSTGFGHWFGVLSTRIGTATGRSGLVISQCSFNGILGLRGIAEDPRIIATQMNPQQYLCYWDEQTVGPERRGPVAVPIMTEVGDFGLAASYEPLIRNGPELESDDARFWTAIAQWYSNSAQEQSEIPAYYSDSQDLTGGTPVTLAGVTIYPAQEEVGYKLMKRLWLWSAWAHVADRSGQTRRALAFTTRDYWDAGTLTALNPLTNLIQTIVPTRPFGPAFYTSRAIVTGAESYISAMPNPTTYNILDNTTPYSIQQFIDAGGGAGYYISDAALDQIQPGSASAPSAWIIPEDVLDHDAMGDIPQAELSKLQAIAPIVDAYTNLQGSSGVVAQLQSLPNQPLLFTNGLTGFGFFDQNNRLIVVVSNPSADAHAVAIAGSIKLSQIKTATGALATGNYMLTNLFNNTASTFVVSNGAAIIPVSLARWDTLAYAITPAQ